LAAGTDASEKKLNVRDAARWATAGAVALLLARAGADIRPHDHHDRAVRGRRPTDVVARIVTGHMAQTLGQSIIIENVVGAGGTTATTRAARARQ
jgi:tripartite-type tricarboxylate transporter receptor subunit TctC